MASLLRRNLAGPLVFCLGLLLMTRAYLFYGTLLHGWDAQLYYAAAHSLVYDGDLDVTNDLAQTPQPAPFNPDVNGHFRNVGRRPDGRVINHFPVGLSLLEAVGLGVGRGLREVATALGWSISGPFGYSALEVNTVAVLLLAWFAVGMHVLYGIITGFTSLLWRILCMSATWAGTSLLFYSAVFPFMAHTTAFTLLVGIAALSLRLNSRPSVNRTIFLIALLTTLLCLVRPQQAIFTVLLIPWHLNILVRPWRNWVPGTVLGLAVTAAGVLWQCAIHQQNVGRFSILGRDPGNPHPAVSVHFNWLDPQFSLVLYSPTRGLLFVTPVFFLGLFGCLFRPAALPVLCRALVMHNLIQLYLIACWSDPTQGDAFGIRMFCECTPMVTLGILNLYGARRSGRIALGLAVLACMGWTSGLMLLYLRTGLKDVATWGQVVAAVLRTFHVIPR